MSMNWKAKGASEDEIDRLLQHGVERSFFRTAPILRLSRSWDAISWLITRESVRTRRPSSTNPILGGRGLKGDLYGYGASLHSPKDVERHRELVESISVEELRLRFEPRAFSIAEIYPYRGAWDAEYLDPILSDYVKLQRFLKLLSRRGLGMVATMS